MDQDQILVPIEGADAPQTQTQTPKQLSKYAESMAILLNLVSDDQIVGANDLLNSKPQRVGNDVINRVIEKMTAERKVAVEKEVEDGIGKIIEARKAMADAERAFLAAKKKGEEEVVKQIQQLSQKVIDFRTTRNSLAASV